MLLVPRQWHPAAAPESNMSLSLSMTLGSLLSGTAPAPTPRTTTSTPTLTPATSLVSAGESSLEAQEIQKPKLSSFWQGEPIQLKPTKPAAPAEELAVWEACEYLRRFVRDSWGEAAVYAAVIECDVPIARIREFGRLPEREGTRSCTRLIRIPVLAEEIGHQLWKSLSKEVTHEALASEEEQSRLPAAVLSSSNTCLDRDNSQEFERVPFMVDTPRYKQCWICHGQSKYQEFEEVVGTTKSCYRCMECFHTFNIKTTTTAVPDLDTDTGRKTTLPGCLGRVFSLRRGKTKSMPELRQHVEPVKRYDARASSEDAYSPASDQEVKTNGDHNPVSRTEWPESTSRLSWSKSIRGFLNGYSLRKPRHIPRLGSDKPGASEHRRASEPASFGYRLTPKRYWSS